jgi:beta-lactamase regulating signal transducer with metallopeptidase domain
MWHLPDLTLVLDSLGWAVLHSTWEGAVAAFFIWGLRAFTKESAADIRYMAGMVTMVGLLAAFIGTFLYYFSLGAGAAESTISLLGLSNAVGAAAATPEALSPLSVVLNSTNIIGATWAACFAILGARYLAAFRLTHKLRKTGLSDLPSVWQHRFAVLAKKCGANPKTQAFISEHVSSPITFGFFKPIVLVPAWFFTGMDADQCEAVILHELAHIRRHDFLTNILQILIKTVFFYHPAVQYISKGIDADREHSCDDIAVTMTNNPESLARALGTIRLKAARCGGVFALAADGPEAPLMHRLKRLMGAPTQKAQTGAVRGFASTSMLALATALLLTLGATQSQAHPPNEWEVEQKAKVADEQLAGAHDAKKWKNKAYNYSTFTKNGKTYMVKTNAQGKSYVNVDGHWFNTESRPDLKIISPQAPKASKAPYPAVDAAPTLMPAPMPMTTPTITASNSYKWAAPENVEVMAAQAREMAKEQAEIAREFAHEQAELSREWAEEQADYQRELAEAQAEHAREMAEYQREIQAHQHEIEKNHNGHEEHAKDHARDQAELQRELAQEQVEFKREMAELKRELVQEKHEYKRELERAQQEMQREQQEMEREIERDARDSAREEAHAAKERHKAGQEAKKYEKMRARLIPVLTADGFMKSENTEITMKLTEQNIWINNQKLSSSMQGKYCDIVSDYVDRKGDTKKIVFKPGYLHVEAKGKNGHSIYTMNE